MIGTLELPPCAKAAEDHDGALQPALSPVKWFRSQRHLVTRSPEQLRLHPALVRLKLIDSVIELNQVMRWNCPDLREHILITTNGTIVSGFRDWHKAVTDARPVVDCIEYSLTDEEAIEVILIRHQPRRSWNNFKRIRLAMELEPYSQSRALANQIAGGKYKGLANLPEAKRIDVRQEIAYLAGVGARNVSKVKTILQAHPRLIEACQNGALRINRALQLCRLPKGEQVERLSHYLMERSSGKTIHQSISTLRMETIGSQVSVLLRALQLREAREPGSVVMRAGTRKQTVILIGHDCWGDLASLMETDAT